MGSKCREKNRKRMEALKPPPPKKSFIERVKSLFVKDKK